LAQLVAQARDTVGQILIGLDEFIGFMKNDKSSGTASEEEYDDDGPEQDNDFVAGVSHKTTFVCCHYIRSGGRLRSGAAYGACSISMAAKFQRWLVGAVSFKVTVVPLLGVGLFWCWTQ